MPDRPYNVLFPCMGNSARSIPAEALINHWGRDGFRGLSALQVLEHRIKILTSLPLACRDRIKLQGRRDAMGETPGAAA